MKFSLLKPVVKIYNNNYGSKLGEFVIAQLGMGGGVADCGTRTV